MMCSFPRVLIVNGEPPSSHSATGLTLLSLFHGWPTERLACLHASSHEVARGVCGRAWSVSVQDIALVRRAYAFVGRRSERKGATLGTAEEATAGPHWTEQSRSFQAARSLARNQSMAQLGRYRLPPKCLEEIGAFRPDVIYSMLGPNLILRMVLDVLEAYPVPVVPHIMDDWPTTAYTSSVFRPILRRAMRRCLAKVLEAAPLRLAIGHEMADEYQRRYGGKWLPFMNAIDSSLLANAPSPPRARGSVRLTYVGGLHLNRSRSLLDIACALELIAGRQEGAVPRVEFVIYTQPRFAREARAMESQASIVKFGGALQPHEVACVLRASDIVIHVESFDRRSRRYARFSVSTKIPECMAAGRPILAYGPGEVASIRYVGATGCGIAVTTRGTAVLAEALRTLITSPVLRTSLGLRGYQVACERHNATSQRDAFRAALVDAASSR